MQLKVCHKFLKKITSNPLPVVFGPNLVISPAHSKPPINGNFGIFSNKPDLTDRSAKFIPLQNKKNKKLVISLEFKGG